VWPAFWPAVLVVVLLASTRSMLPLRMLPVLMHLAMGAVTYVALFFRFGLSRDERQWVVSALNQLRRRPEGLAAA
jgi:hypothetical protein